MGWPNSDLVKIISTKPTFDKVIRSQGAETEIWQIFYLYREKTPEKVVWSPYHC